MRLLSFKTKKPERMLHIPAPIGNNGPGGKPTFWSSRGARMGTCCVIYA